MSVIKPKSKAGPILFFIILIIFIVGAFVYTGNDTGIIDHDASVDIDALIFGFAALAHGDIAGFMDGLFAGIVIVALFMVLFAITHFLFTHALKKVFPRKVHGTVLALVVSLYGFVDHRVYNYLLSLNAFAVGFIVFCAGIIMIWGFTDHSAKRFEQEWKIAQKTKKAFSGDKKDIKELKRLIKEQRKKASFD